MVGLLLVVIEQKKKLGRRPKMTWRGQAKEQIEFKGENDDDRT